MKSKYELKFLDDELSIGIIYEDGCHYVDWAVIWNDKLCTDLDCVEHVKKSSYWKEKIDERVRELEAEDTDVYEPKDLDHRD